MSDDAVTKYETSARAIATAAMGDPVRIATLLSCDLAAPANATACRNDFAKSFERLAFRRPLDLEEIDRYAGVAEVASAELGDFNSGIEYAIRTLPAKPSRPDHTATPGARARPRRRRRSGAGTSR